MNDPEFYILTLAFQYMYGLLPTCNFWQIKNLDSPFLIIVFKKIIFMNFSSVENRLRDEHFLPLCPLWMVKKRYLPLNRPCDSCNGTIFHLNSCYEFLDGLSWTCNNSK